MELSKHTIGIWGLGTSGTALLHFLAQQNCKLVASDNKSLSPQQKQFFTQHHITFIQDTPTQRQNFFNACDIIIPSPGIDISTYQGYAKFLSEIDIFTLFWKKPTIAITGSIGKTSLAYLSTAVLETSDQSIALGGNIGTALMDLLPLQEQSNHAVLELSSFQLEYNQTYAPDIAIITNIHPNHLNRHVTMQAYTAAKLQLLQHQSPKQLAIVPLELATTIRSHIKTNRPLIFFSDKSPTTDEKKLIQTKDKLFYYDTAGNLCKNNKVLLNENSVPKNSFPITWVIISALLDTLKINPSLLKKCTLPSLPSHRLELVGTYQGVTFINDSKATVMPATTAALKTLSTPIKFLLLGGTSKGTDRSAYIAQLATANHIYCFGQEAQELLTLCKKHDITASSHATLDKAFTAAINSANEGTTILLSPGGASFDLFVNYKARGNYFKQLVQDFARKDLIPADTLAVEQDQWA